MVVLLVGGGVDGSCPALTLGEALVERLGHDVLHSRGVERSDSLEWMRLIRRADVVVLIAYHLDEFLLRQLAIAGIKGKPVVRWWVGTDVLIACTDRIQGELSRKLARTTYAQLAVAAHLVDELLECGIHARFVPSVTTSITSMPHAGRQLPEGVLVYLPSHRRHFYGGEVLRSAIEQLPQMSFHIVADVEHSLHRYANVKSYGWVTPLDDVWQNVGCLMRVTEHDGLPRMVIDALLRERWVVYSWPFPGCILARDVDSVVSGLSKFYESRRPNIDGRVACGRLLTPDPAVQFSNVLEHASMAASNRISACLDAMSLTVKIKLHALVSRVIGTKALVTL